MALVIAGHQRSGTTILHLVCSRHPQIEMTLEFANFTQVGMKFEIYTHFMWRRWWFNLRNRNWALAAPSHKVLWRVRLANNQFIARYMFFIYRYRQPYVDAPLINSVMHRLFANALVVGDKYPDYIFNLDNLVKQKDLKRVVIYRDARDVVSSTLKKARTDWQSLPFSEKMNSAAKVAQRWVEAIEIMERHREMIYCLRYENLVSDPVALLTDLGRWLGVQPDGFPAHWIKDTSVGKHDTGLNSDELSTVLDIAGPTMSRLGYEF